MKSVEPPNCVETGTYYNPIYDRYEAWAVDQSTGEKTLCGWMKNDFDSRHVFKLAKEECGRMVWKPFVESVFSSISKSEETRP